MFGAGASMTSIVMGGRSGGTSSSFHSGAVKTTPVAGRLVVGNVEFGGDPRAQETAAVRRLASATPRGCGPSPGNITAPLRLRRGH